MCWVSRFGAVTLTIDLLGGPNIVNLKVSPENIDRNSPLKVYRKEERIAGHTRNPVSSKSLGVSEKNVVPSIIY